MVEYFIKHEYELKKLGRDDLINYYRALSDLIERVHGISFEKEPTLSNKDLVDVIIERQKRFIDIKSLLACSLREWGLKNPNARIYIDD